MLATLFVAISTLIRVILKHTIFQFESTSSYFNFYIISFDWLKQLRSHINGWPYLCLLLLLLLQRGDWCKAELAATIALQLLTVLLGG
jgi:hypothetical protein